MIRNFLRKLLRPLRFIYRHAPLPTPLKQRLKGIFLRTFSFAISNTGVYQRWATYEEIAAVKGLPRAVANLESTGRLHEVGGTWEWQSYAEVSSQIKKILYRRTLSRSPSPVPMLSVRRDLRKAASSLKFPAPGNNPDVSIIIPVFNNIRFTLECLLSISKHLSGKTSIEIIVANDASTDETKEILGDIDNIRVRTNTENLGFLRNCNAALEDVRGRYVLFLNNDVQVTRDWLEPLVNTFRQHPLAGAVGSRILYPNGYLQEAGGAIRPDGTTDMVGLGEDPDQPKFRYVRRVDYCSAACLMIPTELLKEVGGFSDEFAPNYCEDSDLCLKVRNAGYFVYYNPASTIVHYLSKTTAMLESDFKYRSVTSNLVTLRRKWQGCIDQAAAVRPIAFYLPQFHPIPENDRWWGKGFTEWTNVARARPNFVGHYQPRVPADFGYYDLRVAGVMEQQAAIAKRYGIYGFCFYYYWFNAKRLLELPIELILSAGKPEMPFCLCWANENWTRRWDGRDNDVLMEQVYSEADDCAVITDLIRYFRDDRYIRIDRRPLILVYRVDLFPDFAATARRWRSECERQGIGDIYIAMVESFDLAHTGCHPSTFGCDAAVEFPPQGLVQPVPPSGAVLNDEFRGTVADYQDLAVCYATREIPNYTRFHGVVPGWDNTPRRQNDGLCFENTSPGAFQAWLEVVVRQTRLQQFGDERLLFINSWNEWAEGAYLEPDSRFGHTFLEAVRNALDAESLLSHNTCEPGDGS